MRWILARGSGAVALGAALQSDLQPLLQRLLARRPRRLAGVIVRAAAEALRRDGYDTLSLSGAELLLYRQLDELLSGAIITNGTVLTPSRLETIAHCCTMTARTPRFRS